MTSKQKQDAALGQDTHTETNTHKGSSYYHWHRSSWDPLPMCQLRAKGINKNNQLPGKCVNFFIIKMRCKHA